MRLIALLGAGAMAAGTIVAAAPADAQYYRGYHRGDGYRHYPRYDRGYHHYPRGGYGYGYRSGYRPHYGYGYGHRGRGYRNYGYRHRW